MIIHDPSPRSIAPRRRAAAVVIAVALLPLSLWTGWAGAQPNPTLPIADPELTLVGVRDAAPDGTPAQKEPLPLPRREFTAACGTPQPARPPRNLLRWSFDRELGFPDDGFDLYRCCGRTDPPAPGDAGWVKLNLERIRPPRSEAEGQVFVTGIGPMPDQGRDVVAPRMNADEWASYCHLLRDETGRPALCPDLPSSPAGPGAPDMTVAEDPMATLMLASLRPEIAAFLGLYWVDDDGDREDCFYRVEGFWDDTERQAITGPVTAAALEKPHGLELAQTPSEQGSTCAELGGPFAGRSGPSDPGIQLRWHLPEPVLWTPPGEAPIFYNVCRRGPGDTTFEQINSTVYEDPAAGSMRVEAPVLVPRLPVFDAQGNPVLNADGQPELKLPDVFYDHRLDTPVHQGTYGYKVTGMDIFGRESAPSEPAARQWIDTQRPPAAIGLRAETELTEPAVKPATSTVTLRFEWTEEQRSRAPDAAFFRVYRRIDSPDLEVDGIGCPLPLPDPDPSPDPDTEDWVAVGNPIAVEPAPTEVYQLTDTLTLPSAGPPIRHFFYRVVAVDAANNVSAPSGPARGHVIDNNPATPPATMKAVFSKSDWDDTVQVHLLWPRSGEVKGYKLLRSARRPSCMVDEDCPARNCDLEGNCERIPCLPAGDPDDPSAKRCGGPDDGPSHPRGQEDREANLTRGVDPYNPGATLRRLPELRSLAELGNLWDRDETTGAPVAVAPSCRLPGQSQACGDELEAALGADNTQYRQDNLPLKATEQDFFYRVIAVSPAGIQETIEADPGSPSSLSPAFPIRIPDFVAPSAPSLKHVLAHVGNPQDPLDIDAVEIAWPVGPEPDAHVDGAGYTVWRADVDGEPAAPVLVANNGSYTPTGLDPDHCYRFDVRAADEAGQAVGSPLATAVMVGTVTSDSVPSEITWEPPVGVIQVAVEEHHGPLQPLHASKLLPADQQQTIDNLRVFTDRFEARIPTLRAWDHPVQGHLLKAEHDYCYAVGLSDLAGNSSELSRPLLGRLLDTTPPEPPSNLSVARIPGEARLRFSHPESALKATVKRSSSGDDGPWRTLAAQATPTEVPGPATIGGTFDTWIDGNDTEYRFRDLKAQPGRAYWYRVELYDGAGNKSGRLDGVVELEEDG